MWTWIIVGVVGALAILLCFLLAVASFSFDNYASKLKECDQKRNSYGITTLEYVGQINKKYFGERLKITRCEEWKDHYSSGIIALSNKTMSSNSLASLAIVSHELGHARQGASGDTLIKFWKLRRLGKILGRFFLPLIIAGAVLSLLWVFEVLAEIYFLIGGIAFFGAGLFVLAVAMVAKYKEIKIEKEASDFAIEFLREYLLDDEVEVCREFLDSARLTYWAGFIRMLLSWTMLTGKG